METIWNVNSMTNSFIKCKKKNLTVKICIGLGEDFLDLTPKAKINKWSYIKGNCQQNEKAT